MMMSSRASGFLAAVLLLGMGLSSAAAAEPSAGADWPQFRGLERNGASPEKGLLRSWPEGGPKVLWKKPLGSGFASITISGDRLYTMAVEGETESAFCFDAAGKEIWRTPLSPVFPEIFGNGPRSTPTIDGDVVYALAAPGKLYALKKADGSKIWEVDLVKEFGSELPNRGFAPSPLIDGDLLVLEAGGAAGKAVVALDKKTGKTRWTALDGGAGYTSPLAVTVGGVRQYVFVRTMVGDVVSLLPDGKVYWQYAWKGGAIASPLFIPPNRIFASASDDAGAVLLEISKAADGKGAVREVWANRLMKNHFSSSVLHEGHIYGFDNATLKCIDAATGEQKWVQRGFGKGSLILADGLLFVLSDRGVLTLAEAIPSGYVEKGKLQAMEGKTWTAPTLSHGKLFLRDEDEMIVLDVKTPAAPAKTPAAG
ncbi:MAG TPA: PQQ-binding-like beta-propeller repeat protein [Thermoanaerobaculia bacterium]|nr:PQQ-binding-like beta-propeller repeat protein [Thermoanaerobaculia bacterium]